MSLYGKDDITEMQRQFDKFETATNLLFAFFYNCIAYDIPFEPTALPQGKKTETPWADYLANLQDNFLTEKEDGERRGFLDGSTDILKLIKIKGKSPEENAEDEDEHKLKWGIGDEGNPYSQEDYSRLDELFRTYSARLVAAGGMDEQQEDTLRTCCKMRLISDKALAKGTKESIDLAAKLNKMIQDNLSAENLRKKDEKPMQDVRIDSIVDALEKAGLVKQGKILPLPDLQKALLERLGALGGKPSHKYPYTLDAADQMIAIIINTMRQNDNLPEIVDITDNMRLDENVAPEFADSPNKDEREAYDGLGLVRFKQQVESDNEESNKAPTEKETEKTEENNDTESFFE